MRKALPLILIIFRSNDNWIVGEVWGEKMVALLKAPVSVDPNQPPSTGWQFNNNGKFEKDESLICTNQAELPCSSITVSLSGETKEREWYCEGKYESTGLISMGREVNSGYKLSYLILIRFHLQVFEQVGKDRYLYVRPGESIWSVAYELNDRYIWLRGGRASQSCPAHPSSSQPGR